MFESAQHNEYFNKTSFNVILATNVKCVVKIKIHFNLFPVIPQFFFRSFSPLRFGAFNFQLQRLSFTTHN